MAAPACSSCFNNTHTATIYNYEQTHRLCPLGCLSCFWVGSTLMQCQMRIPLQERLNEALEYKRQTIRLIHRCFWLLMPPFSTPEQRAEMLPCIESSKETLASLNEHIAELQAELRHIESVWKTWP